MLLWCAHLASPPQANPEERTAPCLLKLLTVGPDCSQQPLYLATAAAQGAQR